MWNFLNKGHLWKLIVCQTGVFCQTRQLFAGIHPSLSIITAAEQRNDGYIANGMTQFCCQNLNEMSF